MQELPLARIKKIMKLDEDVKVTKKSFCENVYNLVTMVLGIKEAF